MGAVMRKRGSSAMERRRDDPDPDAQTLRIVDVMYACAGNAPDANGRPITILTLAHLGEIEQSLAISYGDTKLLVTKLLQSLADHGNQFAFDLLDEYFTRDHQDGDDIEDNGHTS